MKKKIRVELFEMTIIMLIIVSFIVLLMFGSAKYLIVSFDYWVIETNIGDAKRDGNIYGWTEERRKDYNEYLSQRDDIISNSDIAQFLYTSEDTVTGRLVKLILQITTPCIIVGGCWILYEICAIIILMVSERPWEKSPKKVTR